MNYVMYYDYDNYYDAYENYPRVPDGSVLKMAQCLVKFNCLEEPQISFWVDGEKYKRHEAKSICDKAAKILTYIFAVPIFYSNNYFGESDDVLEIVEVVPEELSQKVAFIENSINTLDNKMDCFEKTLRHLSIAYYNLFKKRDEDAFFFFYKIIECISKEYYDLKKDTFDPEHTINSNLNDINKFLDDYLKRHFKVSLTKNKLYYESKK